MNNFAFRIIFGALLAGTTTAQAQVNAADSVMKSRQRKQTKSWWLW